MTLAALAFAPLSQLGGATLSKRLEDDGYLDRWGGPDTHGQLCVLQLAAEPVDDTRCTLYALTEAHCENLLLSASWQRVALGEMPTRDAHKVIARFNRLADGIEISKRHYNVLPENAVQWPCPATQRPLEIAQHVAAFEHVAPEARLPLFMSALNDRMNLRLQDRLYERRERLLDRYGITSERGDETYTRYTNRMLALHAARP